MSTIHLATYESRNFTFEGVGETEAQAVDVLIQGLRAHADQYELQPTWWYEYRQEAAILRGESRAYAEKPEHLIAWGYVNCRRLESGEAYRDGVALK